LSAIPLAQWDIGGWDFAGNIRTKEPENCAFRYPNNSSPSAVNGPSKVPFNCLRNKGLDMSKKNILVFGATGKQGRVAALGLQQAGFKVRGTSRNLEGDNALELAAAGVDMILADIDDVASVEQSLTDIYGLYLIVPSMHDHDDLGYAKVVLDSALEKGIQHLVYLSYLSADPDHGYAEAKKQLTEDFIRGLGLPYTIVRSVEFMENFNEWWKDEILKDGVSDPRDGDFPRQFIACKDLASFVVQAFQHPEQWIGRAINVAGDEMTNTELAGIFCRVLGRSVPLNRITWEEWEERYHIPSVIVDVWKWYERTRFVADVEALREQYPNMQRLEDFLRETGWDKLSHHSKVSRKP
jgi:uncharacterized protein YbjT (DUF2867 family)